MSSQRCLFASRLVSLRRWRLELCSLTLKATVIFCSFTMPSSCQLGVSITSAPIITASAASFLKTWRPCLQVLSKIPHFKYKYDLLTGSVSLLFQEAKRVPTQTKAGNKLAVTFPKSVKKNCVATGTLKATAVSSSSISEDFQGWL